MFEIPYSGVNLAPMQNDKNNPFFKCPGRPSTSKASTLHDSRVSDDIRFDGRDLVIATADGKR